MKYKILLLILLSVFICTATFGQSTKELSLNFNQMDFSYLKQGMYTKIVSSNTDMFLWGDTIDPALPFIGVNVLIAPDKEYEDFILTCDSVLALEDIVLAPNPIPMPTSRVIGDEGIRNIEYKQAIYPSSNIIYTGTHLMDGYKYLSFVVCPFVYNAVTKKLFLKSNLDVTINFKEQAVSSRVLSKHRVKHPGKNMEGVVKKLTVNGGDINVLYPQNKQIKNIVRDSTGYSFDYLIITDSILRPVFETLAEWKTIKGLKSKVVTTEECYANYPEDTPQMAIKKTLADYYEEGMSYALLGGDVANVPTQICYIRPTTDDTKDMPTDLFYACLDNDMSWDADGDHIYAELSDSVDFAPEFIVSRLSVSTPDEAMAVVNRIIEYERAPMTKGWNKSMLSCGSKLYKSIIKNGVQISDSQWQGEYVYENAVRPFWDGTFYELFDTYTDHEAGADYEVNASHLQSELEKGYAFVDEFSHGWINNWGFLENWSTYVNQTAESLHNDNYTIISSVACYTNAFDITPMDTIAGSTPFPVCLSEAFLRNPYSGVLAYLGSSREGWSSISYYFDEKFYESLFAGDDKRFGSAAMNARISFLCSSNLTTYNLYRWLIMSLNPLGDPEMPVFIETPQPFDNVQVTFSEGNLFLSTGVDSCTICISSVADHGGSIYNVIKNVNTTTVNGINDDCYLCITKQGYVPYVARIGRNVYLQNETFSLDLPIFSDNTHIGYNVTTTKPAGQVSIEKGKVVNISQESFVIENSFELKTGAEMEIKTP